MGQMPPRDISEVPGATAAFAGKASWSSRGGASASFMALLESGCSTALQVLGDSTGNDSGEWVDLLAADLAASYPNMQVRYRVWNDTTRTYNDPVMKSSGSPRYGTLLGTTQNYLTIASDSTNAITGDIDIRWYGSLDAVLPANDSTLISKFGNAGERDWRFYVPTNGRLAFIWTADGTNQITKASTVGPAWTNGQPLWVRVTLQVATGQVLFYTSTDGITWTALGTAPTAAGATSIFASAWPLEIGSRTGGGADLLKGAVYEVDVRNGIIASSPSCVPRMPEAWKAIGNVAFSGTPVLDIINGCHPGASLAYLNLNAAIRSQMMPLFGQSLVVLDDSHNEGGNVGPAMLSLYDSYLTNIRARLAYAGVVVLTQNPRKSPAINIREHAVRCAQLLSWARDNRCSAIDIYRAFTTDSRGLSVLVGADGVHPTATGSVLWKSTVLAALRERV